MTDLYSTISALVSQADNTFLIAAVSIVGLCIFLARQVIKMRGELQSLKNDRFKSKNEAIVATFRTLNDLDKSGISKPDIILIKEHLSKELGVNLTQGAAAPNTSIADSETALAEASKLEPDNLQDYLPEGVYLQKITRGQRFKMFVSGLFLFGFMSVWSAGWSTAVILGGWSIVDSVLTDLLSAIVAFEVWNILVNLLITLIGGAIWVGVGVIPVVLALGGVVGGILSMAIAVAPSLGRSKSLRWLDRALPHWS